jgi:hypothetical protein
MRGRKLWRGIRGVGVFTLTGVVILLYLIWRLFQFHQQDGFAFRPQSVIAPLLFLAVVLVPVAVRWGRYRPWASTQSCSEVIPPLMASEREFCVVLRPFGSDGEIVLPHRMHGASTIEQVIARSARQAAGLATYAVVDQERRLAPPGPVFVRAAHDEWQGAVSTLISRAHSVVLILPPGQEIRESFRWEIDQLTHRGLQTRVTIVLPPDRLYRHDFQPRFHDACIVAAALEGFARSVDDVDSMRVHDLQLTIPARAHVLLSTQAAGQPPQLTGPGSEDLRAPGGRVPGHRA